MVGVGGSGETGTTVRVAVAPDSGAIPWGRLQAVSKNIRINNEKQTFFIMLLHWFFRNIFFISLLTQLIEPLRI
jgi:hypothetical protein